MANPQFEIVVSKNDAEVVRRSLSQGEYVVGQDKAADIVVDIPNVSPKHARLTVDDGALYIEDLGSDAGTYVNDREVKDNTRVWPSQKIRLGDAMVEAHALEDSSAAPVAEEAVPTEVVTERTYEIEKVIMHEEEGPVLDTHDPAIRRDLAMKVMNPGGTEAEVAKFIGEAQITGQLEHPSIPPIHEVGTDEQGRPYYTMKVVKGMTLQKVLELLHDGQRDAILKFPLQRLLAILQKVCEAVGFAHSKGFIHCDLKPESINVGDHGEVLVMDWGSAAVLDANGVAISKPGSKTCTTATCPQYLAPEQARGDQSPLDTRVDIYALGAILFHMLSLRSPVSSDDPQASLKLIAEGHTDRLDIGQKYPHMPRERIPDPLAAIVAKAMALQPATRYQRVDSLQTDILAYQNATITEAEQVGPVRQFFFVVNRYKVVSMASAIVVGGSLFFGISAVIAAIQAHKSSVVDRAVVTNLRSKAPEFVKLAENQADTQRFEDSLTTIDAAIAVDPNPPRPYWEKAWALLALERWDDAVAALNAAQQRGPAGADPARVIAAAQKMKAVAKDPQRWKNDSAHEIYRYLESAGAAGPAFAIATKLTENAEARRKLVDQRLGGALGRDRYTVTVQSGGQLALSVVGQPLRNLDAVRGLPIEILDASGTAVTDVEALRGLRLMSLNLSNTKLIAVNALQGMPLRKLVLDNTPLNNIAPLKGLPLETLSLEGTKVYDFTVVKGMATLRTLNLKNTVMTNLNVLQGGSFETLNLSGTFVSDLTPLQGSPIKDLNLRGCKKLIDLRPVLNLPHLEKLSCDVVSKELAAGLRQSKTLQTIEADVFPGEGYQGTRPVANFWADYDAKGPK